MAKRGEEQLADKIGERILRIRGRRVMPDAGLAALYGVCTKRLNEQDRRNRRRFPDDFGSRLDETEKAEVAAKCDHLVSPCERPRVGSYVASRRLHLLAGATEDEKELPNTYIVGTLYL